MNQLQFENLINPIKYSEFIEQYWEKQPLILQSNKVKRYSNLINLKDLDFLLFSIAQPPTKNSPRVLLSKSSKSANNTEPSKNEETGLFNRNKLIEGYKDGSTVVMYNQEDHFEPLARLCQEFEKKLGHPTHSAVFLTPPHSSGFKAHYDKFDVFVLQIEGTKHWKVYDATVQFPLVPTATPFLGKLPPPSREIELNPGDFLYIPRGHVHETSTKDIYSLHVSLAVDVFTWIDLLLEMMKSEPELRRGLPIQTMLSKNAQTLDPNCVKKIEEILANDKIIDHAFRKIHSKFVKTKKSSHKRDFDLHSSFAPITNETLLRKKEGIFYSLVTEYDRTTLYFGAEEVTGPSSIEPSLQYILNTDCFSVKTMPDAMSEASNMVLVKSLLKEDFLIVAN